MDVDRTYPLLVLLLAVASLSAGCLDRPADHAIIHNDGTEAVQAHVTFSSPDAVVREATRTLEPGGSFRFSLDHPADGTYGLIVETEDGRSAEMSVTWQGSTGPDRVRFYIHDDGIEGEQLT